MSTQVIRVESYTKGSLGTIGRECDRADVNHRNTDIDKERSDLNHSYKDASRGFVAEYADIRTALNAQGKETKTGIAFEGMIVTADLPFFERLGYEQGKPMTKEVKSFFDDAYTFARQQIGYQGTDKNILSAKIHMDERTPHLHLYYLPITEKWQEKIYAKGEDGRVLRTVTGSPIQAKDENGKTIYKQVENTNNPKLARSEFWRVRGAQHSYRQMQDRFQEDIGKRYGLERGEIGSDREYTRTAQFKAEQLQQEQGKLEKEIRPYQELKRGMDEAEKHGKTVLPGVVAIQKKSLEAIKEQAKAYSVNREEIDHVRERERIVEGKERKVEQKEERLDEREKAIDNRQQIIDEMYQRQLTLNQTLEHTENERDRLKLELKDKERAIDALRGQNRSLEAARDKIGVEHAGEVKDLTERIRGGYESLSSAVKAVGMLKWDKEDGYGVQGLTVKQSRLIDAIGDYGADWARQEGFKDLAESMDKSIGISRGIRTAEKALVPKRSRDLDLGR